MNINIVKLIDNKLQTYKIFIIFITFFNLLHLLYLLILGYYSNLMLDDYCIIYNYNSLGFFPSIKEWYYHWGGRLGGYFLYNVIISSLDFIKLNFIYFVLLFLFFIFAIYRFVKTIVFKFIHINNNKNILIINSSIFIFNLFTITLLDFKILFLIDGSISYIISILFIILCFTEILSGTKSIFSYFLLFIFAFFSVTLIEVSFLSYYFLLFIILLFVFYFENFKFSYSKKNLIFKKTFFTIIVSTLFFIVLINSPGNQIREISSNYQSISIFNAIKLTFSVLRWEFFPILTNSYKVSILFIIIPVFIYIGSLFRKNNNINTNIAALSILISIFLIFIIIYLSLVPCVKVYQNIGPLRTTTIISFYLIIFIVVFSFIIGYFTSTSQKVSFVLSIIALIILTINTSNDFRFKLPDSIKYSLAQRERVHYLLELKKNGNKKTIELDSLYNTPNVVYYNAEILPDSTNKDYWINQCMCDGLKLGYKIKLKYYPKRNNEFANKKY